MADSPTRRSSIPILKQTNKTKSFQSYVSLNLTDDQCQQRKSRSPSSLSSMSPPILENPKLPPRPLARSMIHSVPKLEIDNDIIITKLCDENKRLKEHQTQLVSKYEEALRENMEIQNKNDELQKELLQSRREVAEKIQLQRTVENLQKQQFSMDDKNKKLQKKLEEILPESIKDEVISRDISDSSSSDLQNIMSELERLKSYLNQTELQLYEANEHISDLLEKKHEMEVEHLSLKSSNAELNNLTKLMQANMYETLSTSKRMEETFLRVKTERDELIKRNNNRDSTDGGKTARDSTMTDEISNLKIELNRQKKAYEAQFIEYKQNLETEIEERLNSEVESLKIQVKLLESELEISRMRAESCEEELRQLKATLRLSAKMTEMDASTSTNDDAAKEIPKPPPPPPPPMPNLLNSTLTNNAFRSRSNSQTLNDAINDAQQKLQQTSELIKAKKATGLEAVIDDLKNGRVTLRRRPQQPKVPLSPKEAFTGIYQLLEKNQQQNRNSRKILDNELSTVFKKFNLNI